MSTGAASALRAVTRLDGEIDAAVSRGGCVDMASVVFEDIQAPTLLIVGDGDTQVLELNRAAYQRLPYEKAREGTRRGATVAVD